MVMRDVLGGDDCGGIEKQSQKLLIRRVMTFLCEISNGICNLTQPTWCCCLLTGLDCL